MGITAKQRRKCDAVLNLLESPPPEPEQPKPEKPRRHKKWIFPPKFPLLTDQFYIAWCNHWKNLKYSCPRIDSKPPELFPDLYLKPRRLNEYAKKFLLITGVNKELLKKINYIQRTGGFVDCRHTTDIMMSMHKFCKRKRVHRQRIQNEIKRQNIYLYNRLVGARSNQHTTKELDTIWLETKEKLILGSQLPFILFETLGTIDKNMKDPAFDGPNYMRPKVWMEFRVPEGAKLGCVIIELFTDVVPQTCKLFLMLLKGDSKGHAYLGTNIFRIIPDLFCRGGDVMKNNGFGGFHLDPNFVSGMEPENFYLNHSVPGVMSMAVNKYHEITGQFNIIFKPLPQLDGKHVVFGRIISGPPLTLVRMSALGLPLGTPAAPVVISGCGWFVRRRRFHGLPNTIIDKCNK